jgi:BlaI family penicillinase repressor
MTPPRPRPPTTIPEAELAILKALWDGGPATVRELLDRLGNEQAYTTVQTLVGRLVDKGHVRADRKDLAHRFVAITARDELASRQVEEVASSLLDGAVAPLVLRLVEQGRFSAAEIARFRELLAAAEKKQSGGKGKGRGGAP